jgi:hypothetical protein
MPALFLKHLFDNGGMAEDIFVALRDQYRCSAISRGDSRGCQLQTPQHGAHAAVWSDPPKVSRRGRAMPPAQLTRSTEEREWTEPSADGAAARGERLRWQVSQMP